jgi:hypothetical protein
LCDCHSSVSMMSGPVSSASTSKLTAFLNHPAGKLCRSKLDLSKDFVSLYMH